MIGELNGRRRVMIRPLFVLGLARKFYTLIREHYDAAPTDRETVFEILNAIAMVAGTVIKATDLEALQFFHNALKVQLDAAARDENRQRTEDYSLS